MAMLAKITWACIARRRLQRGLLTGYNGESAAGRIQRGWVLEVLLGCMQNFNVNNMPMLALRGLMIFPHMVLNFDVGRDKSIAALEAAMLEDQSIYLAMQKDIKDEDPAPDQIHSIGTVAKIKQILKMPGDVVRVMVEGVCRARAIQFVETEPFLRVELEIYEDVEGEPDIQRQAMMRLLCDRFAEFVSAGGKASAETVETLREIESAGQLADVIAASTVARLEQRQDVLEALDIDLRMERVYEYMQRELELLRLEQRVQSRMKRQIDKNQKEFYLREQIKAIRKELGENESEQTDELAERARKMALPQEVREKVDKELGRLGRMAPGTPEISQLQTYIEWVLDLPWGVYTDDDIRLQKAQKVLDAEHYGLQKVKERIVEHLAVHQLTRSVKGPILCFAGPPGVGKTSIARSIAHAMNRKFVRISLGGTRDEADIRGHRRTYIGAIPGRIITGMKQSGSMNPVFLLDEVDKLGHDMRGDPAAALLEVLDAEQNSAFRDHYLEVAFDLSQVLFLTTANDIGAIPGPLRDRMEIINLPGYTIEDKVQIAKKHLLPKQMEAHGLQKDMLHIAPAVLRAIADDYTREAGVRQMERQLAAVCRKAARKIAAGEAESVTLRKKDLEEYLGKPVFKRQELMGERLPGLVTGLAWTSYGGDTLPIEVAAMKGTGAVELTGQLGDVMKESAHAAISYIRTIGPAIKIPDEFPKGMDLHIHIPEGAIPKDGPSAGISMATAIVSALTGRPVREHLAMTGEITLLGRVLAVGGIREKVMAAYAQGVREIIMPAENRADIEEVPQSIRDKMTFHFVAHFRQVLDLVFTKAKGE